MEKIVYTAVIEADYGTVLENRIANAIKHPQERGNRVELQYSTSVVDGKIRYSALMIEYEKVSTGK